MLDYIIKTSLKQRLLVVAFASFVLVYGALSLSKLPVDVFPELTRPTVTVMVETHGRAPEEVETLITIPLEYNLTGLTGLERIRSTSSTGLAVIYLEFSWDTDIYRARQLVSERLNLAKERLPDDIQPFMAPISSLMGQIQQIALVSLDQKVSPLELRTLAEWTLRPRLMMIPGVTQVTAIGGGLKQYQIFISADKLSQYQLDLSDVDQSLSKISKNTSGGFFTEGSQEILVRNIGAVRSINDINQTVVGLHFGRPVLVSDIAEVKLGAKVKRGDGSYMGRPAVVMVIQKQPGANTVAITKAVDQLVEDIKGDLPDGIKIDTDVFKQSRFIEASIDGILSKLRLGTVLVFIILLIFLLNLRMSLVTLSAIPLSFMVSFIVFRFFGLSINTMTLGGLAIAIGELVDDSIVDVENIFRRLRENATRENPRPFLKVIYEASSEVRNSIVLATFIIALVFLPLFQLTGLEGQLFTPLAIAYLTALIASLVVSLTLTPVLSSYLLKEKNVAKMKTKDSPLVEWLKKWDRRFLENLLTKPIRVILITIALFVVSVVMSFRLGADFLPKFNEGTVMIALFSPPGISLQQSNQVGGLAEEKIMEVAGVKSVSRRTGRGERDEHAMGVHVSEIDVDFESHAQSNREEVLTEIRKSLSQIPNVAFNVGQPISHLMDHTLSGVSAEIALKIFGEDLDLLRMKAAELKEKIKDVKGLVDLKVEQQALVPQLKIHVLRDEAARYNLSSGEITHLLEAALNGHVTGEVIEGQKFFDLFYRFDKESRSSAEDIRKAVLKTMPDGRKVQVGDVADVYQTQGPNEISRENGLRRIVISANVSGRDLISVVNEIKSIEKRDLQLPETYFVTYGGQFEAQETASRKIYLFGSLALLAIALLLFSHFRTLAITAQIMLTVPFAFIGGMMSLYFAGESFTVASLVGFITLCGISSRNGIMMISHYLHLMRFEGESFSKEMVIRGSLERLTPVLMTAMVASFALMPLVFAKGQPGSEILHPVALVIVGGLASSTLLDILVTPVVFYNFARKGVSIYMERNNLKEGLL